MTETTATPPSTVERILDAAVKRFATNSYEATGLREIASDAGVDVAYVHRRFGSKEALFLEAVHASMSNERFQDSSLEAFCDRIAKTAITSKNATGISPIDIVARSFSSPEAAQVIRKLLSEDFIAPLRENFPQIDERDAALAASVLCGVLILRDVVGASPIVAEDPRVLEDIVSKLVLAALRR